MVVRLSWLFVLPTVFHLNLNFIGSILLAIFNPEVLVLFQIWMKVQGIKSKKEAERSNKKSKIYFLVLEFLSCKHIYCKGRRHHRTLENVIRINIKNRRFEVCEVSWSDTAAHHWWGILCLNNSHAFVYVYSLPLRI